MNMSMQTTGQCYTERRALLQKMMSDHPQDSDVSDKEFGKWLFEYLLAPGRSITYQMQQLRDLHGEDSY